MRRGETDRGGRRSVMVVVVALCLLAGCQPAASGDPASSCAQPASWPAPGAKPGQPAAEMAACLQDRAYQTRTLAIPVEAAANGVVAQCEIEVDRFEGVTFPNRSADEDRQVLQQATADVLQIRRCAGR